VALQELLEILEVRVLAEVLVHQDKLEVRETAELVVPLDHREVLVVMEEVLEHLVNLDVVQDQHNLPNQNMKILL
jgi:hypothetical protein